MTRDSSSSLRWRAIHRHMHEHQHISRTARSRPVLHISPVLVIASADFWAPIQATEPYRVVLSHMRDRLYNTRQVLHQCLIHPSMSVRGALEEGGCYLDVEDLAKPLHMMYDSLMGTGDESVANARLLDLLRQVRLGGRAHAWAHACMHGWVCAYVARCWPACRAPSRGADSRDGACAFARGCCNCGMARAGCATMLPALPPAARAHARACRCARLG